MRGLFEGNESCYTAAYSDKVGIRLMRAPSLPVVVDDGALNKPDHPDSVAKRSEPRASAGILS